MFLHFICGIDATSLVVTFSGSVFTAYPLIGMSLCTIFPEEIDDILMFCTKLSIACFSSKRYCFQRFEVGKNHTNIIKSELSLRSTFFSSLMPHYPRLGLISTKLPMI